MNEEFWLIVFALPLIIVFAIVYFGIMPVFGLSGNSKIVVATILTTVISVPIYWGIINMDSSPSKVATASSRMAARPGPRGMLR